MARKSRGVPRSTVSRGSGTVRKARPRPRNTARAAGHRGLGHRAPVPRARPRPSGPRTGRRPRRPYRPPRPLPRPPAFPCAGETVRSRLPNHPQPVAPIYQPEVAARAVVYAAEHPRRVPAEPHQGDADRPVRMGVRSDQLAVPGGVVVARRAAALGIAGCQRRERNVAFRHGAIAGAERHRRLAAVSRGAAVPLGKGLQPAGQPVGATSIHRPPPGPSFSTTQSLRMITIRYINSWPAPAPRQPPAGLPRGGPDPRDRPPAASERKRGRPSVLAKRRPGRGRRG